MGERSFPLHSQFAMAAITTCKNCHSNDFDKDHQTGELVCRNCGSVAEESRIVSEVSFSETSSGKAIVTGQYVSHDQTGVLSASLYGVQGESRQQTIFKARHRMERIGHRLGMADHIIEAGMRYFLAALSNNFVKGRKSQHVLSACLYLSCRMAKTDHMLMDFAELIHVNVFHIGATYLQLVRNQNIDQLPIVDPTVYIQRFVSKLQFGSEGSRRVVEDAKRLVARMGKDWLQNGRRPAGVAAACILLAARMNNFRRSKAEIVSVAKVAEETLQRRLDEFKSTAAGTLTIYDFRNVDVESAADPPSFTRHRELEKKLLDKLSQDNELRAQGVEPEEDPYLNPELVAIAQELDKQDGQTLQLTQEVNSLLDTPGLQKAVEDIAAQPHPKRKSSAIDDSESEDDSEDSDAEQEAERAFDEAVSAGTEAVMAAVEAPLEPASVPVRPDFYSKGRVEQFLKSFRQRQSQRLEDEVQAKKMRAQAEAQARAAAPDEESLSDIDDDEIESVLLNETEIEQKSQVWVSINREYLLEQERKRLRREADIASGETKAPRKRRRRPKQEPGSAASAEAAAANMLREKAPSKKINQAALKKLFAKAE